MATKSRSSSKPHALAVPMPFQGHIQPLMQLSKKLVSAGFMVTFANTQANHARIKGFAHQKTTEEGAGHDKDEEVEEARGDFRLVSLEEGIPEEVDRVVDILVELYKPNVSAAVARLLARLCETDPPVTLLVFDFRLVSLLDVAKAAGIPCLAFWTQSAASFACNLLVAQGFQLPPDDSTLITNIQGVPPFKRCEISGFFIEQALAPLLAKYAWEPFRRINEPNWIVLNTFEELERTTLNSVHAVAGFQPLVLGPLVDKPLFSVVKGVKEINKIHTQFQWLQSQPEGSVLYISFGTLITLSEEELEELVLGLQGSQQPILWVFRPNLCGSSNRYTEDILSKRLMKQGLVVDWASQLQVLSHPAVGGFFTHCGWNSILEGITAGVPMLCWPIFVDQFLSKRCLEEQWGIGFELEVERGMSKLVSRIGIEKSVRKLMQGSGVKEMREKARSLSGLSKQAIEEGGSSYQNFSHFLQNLDTTSSACQGDYKMSL